MVLYSTTAYIDSSSPTAGPNDNLPTYEMSTTHMNTTSYLNDGFIEVHTVSIGQDPEELVEEAIEKIRILSAKKKHARLGWRGVLIPAHLYAGWNPQIRDQDGRGYR